MNADVELALGPSDTFKRLARERAHGQVTALAGRLLLALTVMGTSVAISATGRVSVELVASLAAAWSFALLVQALAAAVVIVPARARIVTRLRAFELWFQAHVPCRSGFCCRRSTSSSSDAVSMTRCSWRRPSSRWRGPPC
jgi:hypothetical protein